MGRAGFVALFLFGLAVAAPGIAGASDADRFPTNEDLRHIRSVDDPQLSPEGKSALVRIQDAAADGGRSHLFLVPTDGGPARQLTYSPDSDKDGEAQGQWMPDGRSILFVAHRGEHAGLFRLPMDGGEAQALDVTVAPQIDASKAADAVPPPDPKADAKDAATLPVDIAIYRIAPDGEHIAFAAHDPETPGEKRAKDAKADALWVDNDPHGTRLYLFDLATAKTTPVKLPPDVKELAWSPDGERLAVVTEATGNAADLGPAKAAWIVSAADPLHPQKDPDLPPSVESLSWSADGKSLLFLAQAKKDAPPGFLDLFASEPAGKTMRDLSDGYDGSIHGEPPVGLADGSVVQLIARGVDIAVSVWSHQAGAPRLLKMPVAVTLKAVTNATRNGWLFVGSSAGHSPALLFAAQLGDAPKSLSLPPLAPEHLRSVAAQRVQWTSDGLAIDGLLFLPPEPRTGPVPLVLEVHGGPLGAYDDRYDPFVDFLIGRGWAVLRPDPRGSLGRGAEFAAANKNDLGGGDYRDVMAGVDYVLKTAPVDPARLALYGYSYGGEMAGFAEGRTMRFKAIISGAPVIDQYSEYGTEDASWYDRWYFGKPWLSVADAWRQSPIAGAGTAKTPFLLLQGQSDVSDPQGQSYEMYRALRQMGVLVELVTYPRDDHGPMSSAIYGRPVKEPWHGFDARQRIVAFIEHAFQHTGTD